MGIDWVARASIETGCAVSACVSIDDVGTNDPLASAIGTKNPLESGGVYPLKGAVAIAALDAGSPWESGRACPLKGAVAIAALGAECPLNGVVAIAALAGEGAVFTGTGAEREVVQFDGSGS